MGQLVRLYQDSHLGKRLPAYDGRKSLYTAGPLPFISKEFKITLLDEDDGAGGQRCALFSFFAAPVLIFDAELFSNNHFYVLMFSFSHLTNISYCRREREFKVVIKLAARADLHHLGLFLQGRQADAPQEALQVLDIVLRELPTTRYGVRVRLLFQSRNFLFLS